MAVSSADC